MVLDYIEFSSYMYDIFYMETRTKGRRLYNREPDESTKVTKNSSNLLSLSILSIEPVHYWYILTLIDACLT